MTRFGCFLFLLRCCLLRRRRWSPGWLARQVGRARARACFSNALMASPDRFGVAMGHCMHATVMFCFSPNRCEMRGFPNFTWLGHGIKHTHHAHVRKMHVIDRHHAWADRSRSFGFLQSRFSFDPCVGSWVDVTGRKRRPPCGQLFQIRAFPLVVDGTQGSPRAPEQLKGVQHRSCVHTFVFFSPCRQPGASRTLHVLHDSD